MKQFVRNLIWHDNGERANLLIYVFVYMTFAIGAGYQLFGGTPAGQKIEIYSQAAEKFGTSYVETWSILAMVIPILLVWCIGARVRGFISLFAFLGFMLWGYVATIYVTGELWVHLMAGAFPQSMGWAWLWLDIKRYEHNEYGQ